MAAQDIDDLASYQGTKGAADHPEALRLMTQRCIEHMHANEPVHTWPRHPEAYGTARATRVANHLLSYLPTTFRI